MVANSKDEIKDYFGLQKWLLQVLGLSLSPKLNLFYKICSDVMVFLMLIYIFLMMPDLFKYSGNFDDFIDSWMYGTGFLVIMVKVLTVFLNRSKLNNILNALQSGVFVPDPKHGGEIGIIWLKECVALTRKLTIVSTFLGLATTGSCLMGSYLVYKTQGSKTLPFGLASILSDHCNYQMVIAYQTFVFGIGIEAFMVVYVVYSTVLAHICVQCKILQHFVKRAIKISRSVMIENETSCCTTDNSKIPYRYLQRTLKDAVVHHMAILKLSEDVEKVFHIPTLAVFTGMSICFCFIMFQGSQYPFLDPNFFKDFMILTAAMLPLAINSYWGSAVLFESQAVADACYEVDFVGTDVKFQKGLVLIMHRSQKPINLTVGKFAKLSLVTMLGVLRMSYSYFMLLRKVNNSVEY